LRTGRGKKRLGAAGERLQVVFITIDPSGTPPCWAQYARASTPASLRCVVGRADGTDRQGLQDLLSRSRGKTPTDTMDHTAGPYVSTRTDVAVLFVRHGSRWTTSWPPRQLLWTRGLPKLPGRGRNPGALDTTRASPAAGRSEALSHRLHQINLKPANHTGSALTYRRRRRRGRAEHAVTSKGSKTASFPGRGEAQSGPAKDMSTAGPSSTNAEKDVRIMGIGVKESAAADVPLEPRAQRPDRSPVSPDPISRRSPSSVAGPR